MRASDSAGLFSLQVFVYPRHPRNLRVQLRKPGSTGILTLLHKIPVAVPRLRDESTGEFDFEN